MDLGLRSDDRLLILGSSGWFGREIQELLVRSGFPGRVLGQPGPSSGRAVVDEELRIFDPTVVVNFAFLTRERVDVEGESEFRRINSELTERFLHLTDSPAVRLAVTVSSGAAVTEPEHPYGELKAAEEAAALELANPSRAVVVLRTYSVSGAHVRRPRSYAFSDFILQAQTGRLRIGADRPVYRRYVNIQDALKVSLTCGAAGASGIVETGGELLEMGDLASRIDNIVNPSAEVTRAERTSDEPSIYCSDNLSWDEWVLNSGVNPLDLDEQIAAVVQGLTDD